MNAKSGVKAATILVAVALLLGSLGLMAATLSAAQPRQIQGVVTKEGEPSTLLSGASVTLNDAHGQAGPFTTTTASDGTYSFTPPSGFYYLTVRFAGYFDNQTDTFRFDNTLNLVRDIQMEATPAPIHDLTVHVEDGLGASIGGALVEIYDTTAGRNQFIAGALTNATTGNVTFANALWTGDFELRVQREGFEMSVSALSISGDATELVVLNAGIKLVGIARDAEGSFVSVGLVAYLYNNDSGVPDPKRLLTANVTGSSYTFFAYPGNYTVIVDADLMAANVTSLFVHTGMTPQEKRIDRILSPSEEERIDTAIRYQGDDWNSVTLWRNLTLNEDSGISGLPWSDLRHLRLQIDLALGDGDGTLDPSEVDAFRAWLLESGPKYVDTASLFNTSSQYYRSDLVNGTTDHNVSLDLPPSGAVTISSWANYSVVGSSIPEAQPRYFVNLTGSHDTSGRAYVNYTFAVRAIHGYERVLNATVGTVEISGFISILVDPLLDAGDFTTFLTLGRSLNGTARVKVVGPPGRFTELNVSQENYTAVVATEVGILFSAEDSTDPNAPDGQIRPESNFTWTFVNDTLAETGYGLEANITFSLAGNYSGNLTIVETGGNVTYRNFTLFVDGIPPIAVLENNVTGLGINANGTNITVPEGQEIVFFGGNSTDRIHEGANGTVRAWNWDFDGDGDVDATGEMVTFSFSEPGNFTVNLTVVDEAGHESENATLEVVVEDVTPPSVSFVIKDNEDVVVGDSPLTEGAVYTFDASETTDNVDAVDDLVFEWDFGDGNMTMGVTVTYSYEENGDYTLRLNVTDRAGNVGNATQSLVVEPDVEQRPDLEIQGGLRIDPPSPEESSFLGPSIVTLRLNVTNREGRGPANAVLVTFWAFPFGQAPGDSVPIEPRFFDANGTATGPMIDPGETITIEFTWAAGPQGNYTLRVNVTDAREPAVFIGSLNTIQRQIDVRQAGFVLPLIIVAAIGVIGGIPAAILLRRRFGGRRGRERITKR